MLKRNLLLTVLLISSTFLCFAETQPEIFIRLYNQQVYYNGSEVDIQVELRNNGIDPVDFKLADRRVHNIKLDVRTLTNDPVEECDECIKEFISSQPVYYTAVNLKPGEQFSFILKLSDFVEIKASGKYFVKAWFFNEFRTNQKEAAGSNVIEIEIAPPEPVLNETTVAVSPESLKLKPQPLYPDAVVRHILDSRIAAEAEKDQVKKEEFWNQYFLYMDLEELLLKSGAGRREYLTLSETARTNKREEYRQWLINGAKDKDLLLVPTRYEIAKTSYTENNAVVVVYQEFDNGRFIDRKQYSYYLRKMDNIWTIYDYSIVNMLGSAGQ